MLCGSAVKAISPPGVRSPWPKPTQKNLLPAFLDSQTGLNRKLKQGSVAWCSSKCGQSAVQRWACSFRVRQAARTDHRIGDTELRRAGGRFENLGVYANLIKEKFLILQPPKSGGSIVWHATLEYDRHRIGDTEIRRAGGRSEKLGVHAYLKRA